MAGLSPTHITPSTCQSNINMHRIIISEIGIAHVSVCWGFVNSLKVLQRVRISCLACFLFCFSNCLQPERMFAQHDAESLWRY